MEHPKTTFLALLGIGAILVVLSTTGYLNNASNLTTVILFTAFVLAFAMFFDFEKPTVIKAPEFEEKVYG